MRNGPRLRAASIVLCILSLVGGCAPRPIALPTGPSTPLAGAARTLEQATDTCRNIDTLVAELSISGRADGRRLRGRVHAGFARPGAARLEGVAPFGAPVFILVAKGVATTLLLPRDGRVLLNAPPDAVVEALAGVSLGPDDLRAVLSGCVIPEPEATGGRSYPGEWSAIDLRAATAFVRPVDGTLHVVAARRGRLTLAYEEFADGLPRRVRIVAAARDGGAEPSVDLTVRLAQVDVNLPLEASAFTVVVPPDTHPLTLEELRRWGPLGAR